MADRKQAAQTIRFKDLQAMFKRHRIPFYAIHFNSSKPNIRYTLLQLKYDPKEWSSRENGVEFRDDLESPVFPKLKISWRNNKRFLELLFDIGGTPFRHDAYLLKRLEASRDILVALIVYKSGSLGRITPIEDAWTSGNDRKLRLMLEKLVVEERRAEEKKSLEGLKSEVSIGVDVSKKIVQPIMEKYELSADIISRKRRSFASCGYMSTRVFRMMRAKSRNNRPYYFEFNRLIKTSAWSFSKSLLEEFVHFTTPSNSSAWVDEMSLSLRVLKGRNSGDFSSWEEKFLDYFKRAQGVFGIKLSRELKSLLTDLMREARQSMDYEPLLNFAKEHLVKKRFYFEELIHIYDFNHIEKEEVTKALEGLLEIKGTEYSSLIQEEIRRVEALEAEENFGYHEIPDSILDLNRTAYDHSFLNQEKMLLSSLDSYSLAGFTQGSQHNINIMSDFDLSEEQTKAFNYALTIVSLYNPKVREVSVERIGSSEREYFRESEVPHKLGYIGLRLRSPSHSILHEIGHSLERVEGVAHLVTAFFTALFEKEDYVDLSKIMEGVDEGEEGFRGLKLSPYSGKVYPNLLSTEFISTGFEQFHSSSSMLRFAERDYFHFLFIYALVTGKLKEFL